MRLKVILLLLCFLISESVFVLVSSKFKTDAVNEHIVSEISSLKHTYSNSIRTSRYTANILYNTMINNDATLSLFSGAYNASDKEKAVIRQKLYEKLKVMYEQQQIIGLKQLHFHLPDSTSFLRMQRPKDFGDSLKGVRYIVDMANKNKKYYEGFEEGRSFNGFRFVHPLFYHGKHIGSVEIGMSSCYLISNMDSLEPGMHDFIIKKSFANRQVISAEQYNYTDSGIATNYLREINSFEVINPKNGKMGSVEEYLNSFIQIMPEIDKKTASGKAFAIISNYNGKYHISVFMPVLNTRGVQVAYFTNTCLDNKYQHLLDMYNYTIISGTAILLLLFGFIYMILVNNLKTRRLNTALDEKLQEHESQLKFKEEMLFQQSKLASLGEMFSSLAHQWKQPLNILAMYIQNMVDEDESQDSEEHAKREEIVDKCMAQIDYMSETINDFMDFIRPADITQLKMEAVKTSEEIIKLLKPSFEKKKINVILESSKDRFFAKASPNEVKHVLVNILNNAKDAILDIMLKDKTFSGKININIYEENGFCIIKMSDNGGGIRQDVMDKIFMPYITTKKNKDGSGLGLYMCKTIIEKYKGSLSVQNNGSGAEFIIRLPLV